jgi:hypothetical protein
MSKVFNANFNIIGSDDMGGGEWQVTGDVIDYTMDGWSNSDVQVGDAFVDESLFFGTLNRWRVIQIVTIGSSSYPGGNANSIKLRAVWDDLGDSDANGPAGGVAVISRTSPNRRMMWSSSISAQLISDPLATRVAAINNFFNVDPFMAKYVKNVTGVAIPAYSVLCWLDDGTIGLAEADVIAKSDIAGINPTQIANGAWGWIIKTGYIPNALVGLNAIPGAHVYLSEEAGRMTLTSPSPLTDTIVKIGRAEPPSGVVSAVANDLHMEIEFLSEPE